MNAMVPVPRVSIAIRPATMSDYPFIDRLQAMHSKALGFMRKAALEGKIERGEVLVAEGNVKHEDMKHEEGASSCFMSSCFTSPLGYCISTNRYLKRDELGVIYQMNIVPGQQRKLIGAALVRAVFERAPYGCRLCCCWCRQDLAANYFWESLGFVPLAFRAGAGGKSVHIFWQRRIRDGDATTPYWFPAKTDGGMMREDRLVLPIPPGVHWKDVMPVILPGVARAEGGRRRLPDGGKQRAMGATPMLRPPTRKRVQFGSVPIAPAPEPAGGAVKTKPAKPKREKVKADPALVAKARELRDRYLEHLNGERFNQADPAMLPQGKYAVGRLMENEDRGLKMEDRSASSPSSIPSTYSGQALHLPSSSSSRAA